MIGTLPVDSFQVRSSEGGGRGGGGEGRVKLEPRHRPLAAYFLTRRGKKKRREEKKKREEIREGDLPPFFKRKEGGGGEERGNGRTNFRLDFQVPRTLPPFLAFLDYFRRGERGRGGEPGNPCLGRAASVIHLLLTIFTSLRERRKGCVYRRPSPRR